MTEHAPAPPPPQPGGYTQPPSGPSGPRAGFGARLAALLLDTIIILIGVGIVVGIFYAVGGGSAAVVAYLVALVGSIVYYVYFEGGPTGQTPGKKMLGIRVIDFNTGGPIGYPRALGRNLFRSFISAWVCYLGFLWMLWDREKQTWHDKVCSCVVVPTDAYPVP